MGARKQHYVTFLSPGTFFAESTTRPIASWDPVLAVAEAETVVERYNARPYGFRFGTHLVHDPIPDGAGGTLDVHPKTIATSGLHFLGGRLETLDDVTARADPKEATLRANMRCNGWFIICVTENGYRSTQPFDDTSVIVDAKGKTAERGDDPAHVAYRAKCEAAEKRRRATLGG